MDSARIGAMALALLFLLTALAKARFPGPFSGLMERLGFVSRLGRLFLFFLIAFEVTLAGAWWTGWWPEGLGILTALVFLLMVIWLEILWRGGHRESCGCYGGLAKVNPRQGIRLNLVYGALAIFVWSEAKAWSEPNFPWWSLPFGMGLGGYGLFRLRYGLNDPSP